MKIELHVYDKSNNLIFSDYDLKNWSLTNEEVENNVSFNEGIPINHKILVHNIHDYLRNNNYKQGTFHIEYFLYEYVYGELYNDILIIDEISEDKTELRLKTKEDISFSDFDIIINRFELNYINNITNIINFGDNNTYNLVNWSIDKDNTPEFPFSLVVKLETPLSNIIEEKDNSILGFILYDKIKQDIELIPRNKEYNVNILSVPNFDIKINKTAQTDTKYHNWDQLLSDNEEIKNLLINEYFNFYKDSVSLNVDYTEYENFVFYSSIYRRLENFRYKLREIEKIENNISNINIQSFIDKYKEQIEEIKNSFDGYEYFLYYNIDDKAWPKDEDEVLLLTTDETAIEWYETQIDFAILYDKSNINTLNKNIPSAISNDAYNEQFIVFMDMIAQHFDILWLYTKNIDYLTDRNESLYKGLSKDLVYQMLESYGWKPIHDNQFDDLWEYTLGEITEEDGTIRATTDKISRETSTKEVWKRILNNLPYLLKTKGTREGIRSLINCFGIPNTELYINEYGGPNKLDVKSKNIIDKFNYAIKFNTGSKIVVPYMQPGTIEFRFKIDSLTDQTIFQRSDNNVNLEFTYDNDIYGRINYHVEGSFDYESELVPIYNDDWWTFMLRYNSLDGGIYNFEYFLKNTNFNKVIHEYSGSFDVSGSTAISIFDETYDYYIGFTGSLQEFRYWDITLNES